MKWIVKALFCVGLAGLSYTLLMSISKAGNTNYPVEVGPAAFLRSEPNALAQANQSGKPVFAFFQEVPG